MYDNYVTPDTWREHATAASNDNLLFSFNVNPGFDGIVKRNVEPGSCYQPPAIQPLVSPRGHFAVAGGAATGERTANRRHFCGDCRPAD